MVRYIGMACSGKGYVTIVGRKRLWSDHLGRGYVTTMSEPLTKVGIELLGQLKIEFFLKIFCLWSDEFLAFLIGSLKTKIKIAHT